MSRELKVLFNRYSPNVKLHIVLVNSFKISSFFTYKDMLPVNMRSSLVYQFRCAQCASAYVGMTSRYLYSRVAEHKGRSCKSGQLLSRPPHTSMRTHAEQCGVLVSDSDLRVLASTSGTSDLRILKSLYIFELRPSLNSAVAPIPLKL
jgi:hypothetical protein